MSLTNKQKKIINNWCNTNRNRISMAFDCLREGLDLFNQVSKIKETETLHMDINRYVGDIAADYIRR